MNNKSIDISVIVPVSERFDDVEKLFKEYRKALDGTHKAYEFIYVLDGEFEEVSERLLALKEAGEPITIIQLAKWFGEATALTVGFENSTANIILTLPAYYQIEPEGIVDVINKLEECDMVIARRYPRIDSWLNRIQSRVFNGLLNLATGSHFSDLGCGVRVFRRKVMEEVPVYGDQHRFLPLLANRRGFKVAELDVKQSSIDSNIRVYRMGVYPRRMLDIITVFFLVKFTKKPLRFFGLVGMGTFILGGLYLLFLIIERLFFGESLADKPALLISSLMIVLGVQTFALGLIGELIIFTHAKEIKEYTIEKIIN